MTVFSINRDLNAPRDTVWRAWTDPDALKGWWGPKGFVLHHCAMDLRPGGMFLYGMRSPDGAPMWGRWAFREVVAPSRLVFVTSFSDAQAGITRHPMAPTWPAEMLCTLTLEESGQGTRLSLTSTPINATAEEEAIFDAGKPSMTMGWGGTLGQLTDWLAVAPKAAPLIVPYLTVSDATAAIDFYGRAFGALERMVMRAEDGKRLMHVDLALLGGSLFLCDCFPEHGGSQPDKVPPASIALVLPRPADVDALYAQAIAAGGTPKMPPHDAFWGARFAMLTDPFGHNWMLDANLPKT
ncbi:SRPBCC domain-containing protein [Humitalea sp. 24SJ18S-53]|uniref:SRPBCC domain-containing protein n=1 Tax=Humitalea sp. 24SJ18S-53 TaxID=3422307 RepID=UPI003D671961